MQGALAARLAPAGPFIVPVPHVAPLRVHLRSLRVDFALPGAVVEQEKRGRGPAHHGVPGPGTAEGGGLALDLIQMREVGVSLITRLRRQETKQ